MPIDYKRIVKNTFFLYFRSLIILVVSIFTVRIVLDALGVNDYGIYILAGSLVTLLSFLKNTLDSSTQRFLTYELGRKDHNRVSAVFSTSILINIGLIVVLLLISETIGVWYLNTKAIIPIERLAAANWAFQFSVFTVLVSILRSPYTALVIAHEEMHYFAYLSIVEVIAKLFIAYMLYASEYDKLKLYTLLLFFVSVAMFMSFFFYARKKYPESKFRFAPDRALFKTMLGFSSWNLIGVVGWLLSTQGVSIILNLFFGPVANAAVGIAYQINNAINQFIEGFQMAVTPQLTKLFAANELEKLRELLYHNSKYSFLLLWFLSLPVLIEIRSILAWWLVEVPDYAIVFTRLILIYTLLFAFIRPLVMTVQATGKLKHIQLSVGTTLLMIVPISYALLKSGFPPYTPFIVIIGNGFIHLAVELYFLKKYISLSPVYFFRYTVLPAFLVAVLTLLPALFVSYSITDNLMQLLSVFALAYMSTVVCTYYIGMDAAMRHKIKTALQTKFQKVFHR